MAVAAHELPQEIADYAASDLIPELHRPDARRDWRIAPPLFLGAGLIALPGRVVRAH